MLKYLKILAFISLLEYQVIVYNNSYSPITFAGIAFLITVCVISSLRGFSYEHSHYICTNKKDRAISLAVVVIYTLAIIAGIILGQTLGDRIFYLLIIMTIGVILASSYENLRETIPFKTAGPEDAFKPAYISSFTIPKIFLMGLNYLIAGQLGQNLSYQFILLISVVVLYDILSRENDFKNRIENKRIDLENFKSYLFHRWSKYLNIFLGMWFFILLESNNSVTVGGGKIMIALFISAIMIFIYSLIKKLKPIEIAGIVCFSMLLVFIDYLIENIFQIHIQPYLMAFIIFIFYDLGDLYIYFREFRVLKPAIWEQKLVMYTLIAIFIAQVSLVGISPSMNIKNAYAAIFSTEPDLNNSKIKVEDIQNSSAVRHPSSSPQKTD